VARAISHALAAIPYIEPKTFEKTFASHVQDVLMIVYLANLTRAQIAIADRIQQQL
jgi:translation initiation factor 3 subunit F